MMLADTSGGIGTRRTRFQAAVFVVRHLNGPIIPKRARKSRLQGNRKKIFYTIQI